MNIDQHQLQQNLEECISKVIYRTLHVENTTTVLAISYLGKMKITEVTVNTTNDTEFDVIDSKAIAIEKCKHKTFDILCEHEIYNIYRNSGVIETLPIQDN